MKRIFVVGLLGILAFGQISAQDDLKKVQETVHKSAIEAKVHFLASDEMKGRDTPSPELDLASRYLESYLKEQGVKPLNEDGSYFQKVEMTKTEPPQSGTLQLADSSFSFDREMILLSGEDVSVSTELVFLDYGSPEDFEKADLKGKIAVTQIGSKGESNVWAAYSLGKSKAAMAAEKGAVALVELYKYPQPQWKLIRYYLGNGQTGLDNPGSELPYIWLEDVSGERKKIFESFSGEARLDIKGASLEKFTVNNVLGIVEGTDPKLKDEYIIYSAHYDHVGVGKANEQGDTIYNGTRDNAIGTVAVMEAAKNIGRYPLKRSSVFIFFAGEEKGLLGSEWYVNHPVVPLQKTALCLNADNGGYNDTTFAMIVGLERITPQEEIAEACKAFGLEARQDQVLDQGLYRRSDHFSFAEKGVPGVMYSMACTDFDEEIFKYLHQPSDNPNSVNYNYITRYIQSYVYSARLIGNAKDRPYWAEGDDFYKIGEELYD